MRLYGVKGSAEMRLVRRGRRGKRKEALGFMANIPAQAGDIKKEGGGERLLMRFWNDDDGEKLKMSRWEKYKVLVHTGLVTCAS